MSSQHVPHVAALLPVPGGSSGGTRHAPKAAAASPVCCLTAIATLTLPTFCRMEEAYDAAVVQCGGLEAAKPKGVFEAMAATGEFPDLTLQVSAALANWLGIDVSGGWC